MATINPSFYGPELPAFLDTLAHSEGTADGPQDGYGVIVAGIHGPASFDSFDCHPFCVPGHPRPLQVLNHAVPPLESDASGRYQLMARYWAHYQQLLNVPDFGPLSQDKIALQQIREARAYELVQSGKIEEAVSSCNHLWASLPGAPYGQGGKTMTELAEVFQSRLAAYRA